MRKGGRLFYSKLAAQNIRKNRRFYFPYLFTGMLTAAMFYNICFLENSKMLYEMPGGDSVASMMGFGVAVVGLFTVIFLLYTNSFLMKRRQKELGLYNILGMGKRHIGRVLLWETVYTYLSVVGGGLLLGVLISKLLLMILCRMLFFDVPMGFEVSSGAMVTTALLFAAVEALVLVGNMMRVQVSKPIDLLRGGNVGEKEPRAKWVLAVLGVIATGAGYAIALTVDDPVQALAMFFIAVLLVIVGTYLLFTAGSIAVLKLLRRNRHYYYQTRHFTAVSGLLYRMKQNAVGLASICILCTMTVVTVSTTVCLYAGTEDILDTRYPQDVELSQNLSVGEDGVGLRQMVLSAVEKQGRQAENVVEYIDYSFAVGRSDSTFSLDIGPGYDVCVLALVTDTQYSDTIGQSVKLAAGEAIASGLRGEGGWSAVTVGDYTLQVKEWVADIPKAGEDFANLYDTWTLVVSPETYNQLSEMQVAAYGDNASVPTWHFRFDLDGTDEQKVDTYTAMVNTLANVSEWSGRSSCRQVEQDSFYGDFGGLLFLGLFLGALFLMATVLIIYYKQISEGYEDNDRFVIMQKVGMTREEVRASINSQVRLVFFLPLIVAVCHQAGCMRMMSRLLLLFNLNNIGLFLVVTAITLAVFALGYVLVYALTSRTYYRIVSDSEK